MKVAESVCCRCAESVWAIEQVPGRGGEIVGVENVSLTGFCERLKKTVWDDMGGNGSRRIASCSGLVLLQPVDG